MGRIHTDSILKEIIISTQTSRTYIYLHLKEGIHITLVNVKIFLSSCNDIQNYLTVTIHYANPLKSRACYIPKSSLRFHIKMKTSIHGLYFFRSDPSLFFRQKDLRKAKGKPGHIVCHRTKLFLLTPILFLRFAT